VSGGERLFCAQCYLRGAGWVRVDGKSHCPQCGWEMSGGPGPSVQVPDVVQRPDAPDERELDALQPSREAGHE
jgi:hypothetical protein